MMHQVPSSEEVAAQLATRPEEFENPSDLELSVEHLALTNSQIICQLKEVLKEIQLYRKNTNIIKTAGTTVGVGGAILLCAAAAAPFTAGLSAGLSAPLVGTTGLVATGASAVTSIGSNIAYRKKSRQVANNFEKLQEQQRLAAQELTLKLNIINSVVDEIVTTAGVDEKIALKTTIYHISKKTVKLVINGCDFVMKDTVIGKEIVQQVERQMNRLRDMAVAVIISKGAVHPQDLANELSSPLLNAAVRLGQSASRELNEFQVMVRSSAQSLKGVSGRTILRGVGAAVSVVFSIIDVALLIRDWRNPDPLVATINSTIKDLEEDIGKCADILNVLKNFANDEEMLSGEEGMEEDEEATTAAERNMSDITNEESAEASTNLPRVEV